MVVVCLFMGCLAMLLIIALGYSFLKINDKFGKITKDFDNLQKEFVDIKTKFKHISNDIVTASNYVTNLDVWFTKFNKQVGSDVSAVKKEVQLLKELIDDAKNDSWSEDAINVDNE